MTKEKLTHPSYGMARFTRSHGNSKKRLFGSSLDSHYTTVTLTVSPGYWEHDLHHDRYYSDGTNPLVEVELSAAQFAELITTMNMGSGTPCTVRWKDGPVDNLPTIDTETQRIQSSFKDDLAGMIKTMKEYRATIDTAVAKLPDKQRDKVRVALDVMIQQVESNVPFIATQFQEATERVVTAAKAEVEAFTSHAIHAAGLKAIADGRLPALLGDGKEDV